MNANARSYEVRWQEVAWPRATCSTDQEGCAITVSFKLNSLADPDL